MPMTRRTEPTERHKQIAKQWQAKAATWERKRPRPKQKSFAPQKEKPVLVPLKWGQVYCELCHKTIGAGERVAWWRVAVGKQTRPAAYCPECHRTNLRNGRALRPRKAA
jgi:hypothetical protein